MRRQLELDRNCGYRRRMKGYKNNLLVLNLP